MESQIFEIVILLILIKKKREILKKKDWCIIMPYVVRLYEHELTFLLHILLQITA